MRFAIALASILALTSTAQAQPSLVDPALPALTTEQSTATIDEDARLLQHRLAVRRTMSDWMTGLGLGAVVALTTTTVLGVISFSDRYGFRATEQDTPCAQGQAVMQEYCEGTIWPHAIAGGITTTLYVTTSMLGMFMPDPLHVGDQPGRLGERIRAHRTLRVLTSTLVIAQALLGLFISHADDWFGLDRDENFDAMQALAATHLGLGLAAMTSLAAQGAVMIF